MRSMKMQLITHLSFSLSLLSHHLLMRVLPNTQSYRHLSFLRVKSRLLKLWLTRTLLLLSPKIRTLRLFLSNLLRTVHLSQNHSSLRLRTSSRSLKLLSRLLLSLTPLPSRRRPRCRLLLIWVDFLMTRTRLE